MATLESRDDQGEDCGVYETPAVIGDVNPGLRILGGESHKFEEKIGVVRKKRVARHLREQAEHRGDQDTTTHTGSFNHIHPGLFRMCQLDLDGRLDLCHFRLCKYRVRITLGVVLDKNGEGFFVAVLADKKTGALW